MKMRKYRFELDFVLIMPDVRYVKNIEIEAKKKLRSLLGPDTQVHSNIRVMSRPKFNTKKRNGGGEKP